MPTSLPLKQALVVALDCRPRAIAIDGMFLSHRSAAFYGPFYREYRPKWPFNGAQPYDCYANPGGLFEESE